jgi:hypothetical protein
MESTIIVGRTAKINDNLRRQKWQEQQRGKQEKTSFAEILEKARQNTKNE